MEKISIIGTKHGGPGQPEKLGEIEADRFERTSSRAYLGSGAHRQHIAFFGPGYGDRIFHVVYGDEMLVNCCIVQQGGAANLGGCVLQSTA